MIGVGPSRRDYAGGPLVISDARQPTGRGDPAPTPRPVIGLDIGVILTKLRLLGLFQGQFGLGQI